MRADQPVVEADRSLEKDDAVAETLLLKADGAEDGIRDGLRGGIGQRKSRVPFGFIQSTLLNEERGRLQRVAGVWAWSRGLEGCARSSTGGGGRERAEKQRARRGRQAPPPPTGAGTGPGAGGL